MELYNEDAIEITLEMLRSEDSSKRYFAAETLGDIGRSKESKKAKILEALVLVSKTDTSIHVRRVAEHSIRELNGEFDKTSEKYNPHEPIGSLRDQYYLKRG